MRVNSKQVAVLVVGLFFGGIAFSSAVGWWQTESTKQPVAFTEGEFAGMANPADIRGSYTFGDIADSFAVSAETLARAFDVNTDDPAAFAVKELEVLYEDSGYEVGTASVRLFVAWYAGLPFDLAGEEVFLPERAADILVAQGNLKTEQLTYLQDFTVPAGNLPETPPQAEITPQPSTPETAYLIKGKTTFGELISWGLSQDAIETILKGPMPDPAMTAKDYASANGLDFEMLKAALQAEVDKIGK